MEVNLSKLYSRWCVCTSGHSGPNPCWSLITGSCLRQRSRTCSWTSSRCHATLHYANWMTSSNELALPRLVITRNRVNPSGSMSCKTKLRLIGMLFVLQVFSQQTRMSGKLTFCSWWWMEVKHRGSLLLQSLRQPTELSWAEHGNVFNTYSLSIYFTCKTLNPYTSGGHAFTLLLLAQSCQSIMPD